VRGRARVQSRRARVQSRRVSGACPLL
jgi:hypothetical protein